VKLQNVTLSAFLLFGAKQMLQNPGKKIIITAVMK